MTEMAGARRIPGEPGIWVIIFGDLLVFSLFFGTFAYYRMGEPLVFQQAQAALNQGFGLLNTLLLLTSSWAVAKAIGLARDGQGRRARALVTIAMALGAGFAVVKVFEYREKLLAGIGPSTNDFFMLYFTYTGVHLLHVLAGLGALAFLRSRTARPPDAGTIAAMEGCGIFWHLVDILWVVLFAILYLHR
jgi:nitric oxide reductase NorE protein